MNDKIQGKFAGFKCSVQLPVAMISAFVSSIIALTYHVGCGGGISQEEAAFIVATTNDTIETAIEVGSFHSEDIEDFMESPYGQLLRQVVDIAVQAAVESAVEVADDSEPSGSQTEVGPPPSMDQEGSGDEGEEGSGMEFDPSWSPPSTIDE